MDVMIPGFEPAGAIGSGRGANHPVLSPWSLLESRLIAAPAPSPEERDRPMQPKILLCAMLAAVALSGDAARASDYAIGADLSFLKQAEEHGTPFKEDGKVKPGLQIFKDHGYNWIRLRLFHSPRELPNDLPYTMAL